MPISYPHDSAPSKRLIALSSERGICSGRTWARWIALGNLQSVGMGFVGMWRSDQKLERLCVLPSRNFAGPDMTLISYTGLETRQGDQGRGKNETHTNPQDEPYSRKALSGMLTVSFSFYTPLQVVLRSLILGGIDANSLLVT